MKADVRNREDTLPCRLFRIFRDGLRLCTFLARHYEARLFILHAVQPFISIDPGYMSPTLTDEVYSRQAAGARERANELAKKHAGEEVVSEVVVQLGLATDSILSFAKQHDIDLIVIGTHGRRGLDRLVMGSTTEQILRKAHCPVLAVRKPVRDFISPASPDEPVQLRKLLCCVDFSEHSPRALEYAFSLGLQYHAEITLLHVLEDTRRGMDVQEQTRQALKSIEELVPDDARNWSTVVPLARRGKPYQEIMEQAAQAQTDLIVMGVRGRNAVDLALFGSTTHRVIQLGPCPVLVVRA